jgi:radical SAM enzyme (TIGR01210 family)
MNHTRLLETFVPELHQLLEKQLGMSIYDGDGAVILDNNQRPVLTDTQFLHFFQGQDRKPNGGLPNISNKPNLKDLFGDSIFSYRRQVKIFSQIMDNIDSQLEYRKMCKVRERQMFKEELEKEVERERHKRKWQELYNQYCMDNGETKADRFVHDDIKNYILTREWASSQWCTSAFTTEVESTSIYKDKKSAEKIVNKAIKRGLSANIFKSPGRGYKVRYNGGRIACSFRKEECAYKRKYEDDEQHANRLAGCLYCELSAEMRLYSRWASEMRDIESIISSTPPLQNLRNTLSFHQILQNTSTANSIASTIVAKLPNLTPRQEAIVRLIRQGSFKSLDELSLEAVDDIISIAKKDFHPNHSTFEFLPDGSSFNPEELHPDVLLSMMDKVYDAGYPSIAVETRPEYIINNPEYVEQIIDHWQGDGPFEIYFGLETIDTFVASIINNKGYCKKEFLEAVTVLENFPWSIRKKIHCSVYKILKSSYMTEHEALKDAEQMISFVDSLDNATDITFITKVEPAVISHGSMQAALYHKKTTKDDGGYDRIFRPPNYFTVCELLVRAYLNRHRVKIGQRADIDFFDAIPMVWTLENKDQISLIDFAVYYAAQKFATIWNSPGALRSLCIDMYLAIIYFPEFRQWEEETFPDTGKSILKETFDHEMNTPPTSCEQKAIDFQKSVFRSLDQLEFNPDLSELLRDEESSLNDPGKRNSTTTNGMDRIFTFTSERFPVVVKEIFAKENVSVQTVGEIIPTIVNKGDERFYKSEITIDAFVGSDEFAKNNRQTQTIWAQIPEHSTVLTEADKPFFIYGESV